MSVKTTYICDKCGFATGSYGGFFKIELSAAPYNNGYERWQLENVLWCHDCVTKSALRPQTREEKKAGIELPQRPSLEDLIREIVQDAVSECT